MSAIASTELSGDQARAFGQDSVAVASLTREGRFALSMTRGSGVGLGVNVGGGLGVGMAVGDGVETLLQDASPNGRRTVNAKTSDRT
jgi:hypothetical protein